MSDGGARFGSWLEGSRVGVRLLGGCLCPEVVWDLVGVLFLILGRSLCDDVHGICVSFV